MPYDTDITIAELLLDHGCSERMRGLVHANPAPFGASTRDARYQTASRNALKAIHGLGEGMWAEVIRTVDGAYRSGFLISPPVPVRQIDEDLFVRIMPETSDLSDLDRQERFKQAFGVFDHHTQRRLSLIWRVYGVGGPVESQVGISHQLGLSRSRIGTMVKRGHACLLRRQPEFQALLEHHAPAILTMTSGVDMSKPKNWSVLPNVIRVAISGVNQSPNQWVASARTRSRD